MRTSVHRLSVPRQIGDLRGWRTNLRGFVGCGRGVPRATVEASRSSTSEGTTVNTSLQGQRIFLSTLAAVLVALLAASGPAVAKPDPGPSAGAAHLISTPARCPLSRIDTQLVRCDNLTGAGVEAPRWMPRR